MSHHRQIHTRVFQLSPLFPRGARSQLRSFFLNFKLHPIYPWEQPGSRMPVEQAPSMSQDMAYLSRTCGGPMSRKHKVPSSQGGRVDIWTELVRCAVNKISSSGTWTSTTHTFFSQSLIFLYYPWSSVGEVWSRADWDLVWTGPNPVVPVLVWDFPKNTGLLGLQSRHSHIARDRLRPGLDWDHLTYISSIQIIYF